MKKLLLLLAGILLVLWVVSWFRSPEAVATSGARPWPGGLGPLQSVAGRLAARPANAAARKVTALAGALPAIDAIDEFGWREIARAEPAIGQPPAIPDLSAIRDLLLKEPVVWGRAGGIVEVGDRNTSERRVVQMNLARHLLASALSRGRANDPAAWDDLLAIWRLARSLDGQPAMMEQTAAMAMARMINAVAWKMPLPAPAWFAEVQQHDVVQPLLEAFQHQTASYWQGSGQLFPTRWGADAAEHERRIAEALFSETRCDVRAPVNKYGSDLTMVWRRAFRYRAEREATANALRVREGRPIETASRCRDGGWSFDGTTLRFTREIAIAGSDRPMPLVMRVKP